MASNLNEILGRNIDSVKSLKAAIKELQDSLVGLDTESQEYKDTATKLIAAQDALKDTTRAGVEANTAAKDSIVGLQKEYNKLYDAYKKLSDEQRNSDIGKEMAESLEKLSTSINNSKKEVGNFTSNIGRYAQGATEAFSQMGISLGALQTPMKLASKGASTLGGALKKLVANPVGAVIMAIVVAMKALHAIAERVKKAINDNEDSSNRLKVAMATFKPVLDAVSNAFDFLAKIVVNVIEGLAKVAEKIMSIIPGMKKAIQSHKDLAKATNDLTKATREANVENSKKQAEIERLREEASATEDVTEKKRLLEEAKAMQAEVDQKNIELAQEELRILQEYSEKTANSAEENEKLAAAQQKVNDAIAQGEKNARMYNKQLGSLTDTTGGAASAGKSRWQEEKEELEKFNEEYEKSLKTREQLVNEYYDDLLEKAKKHKQDTANIEAARTRDLNAAYAERKAARNEELDRELDDEARHYQNMQQLERDELERELKNLENIQQKLIDVKQEFDVLREDADFGSLFDTIFREGKYDMVGSLDYAIKLMPELKEKLEALGAEGFDTISSNLQKLLGQLQNTHGITIKNFKDLFDNNELLGQQIDDLYQKDVLAIVGKTQLTYAKQQANNIAAYYETFLNDLAEAGGEDGSYFKFFKQFEKNYFAAADLQASALTAEYQTLDKRREILAQLVDDERLATDTRMEIMAEYTSVLEEMTARQQALVDLNNERTNQMWNGLIGWSDGMAGALGTIKSSYESLIDSEVKAGQIDEEQARKKKERLQKLEKWQTAFNIATIAADAAAGIFSVWKGYATEVGEINPQTAAAAGPGAAISLGALNAKSLISAIAKTTSLAATATAQIMAAKNGQIASNNNFAAEGGGGSVGVGATPSLIDTTPYTYSRTVQTTEEEDKLNAPIYVTVTDIEEGLGHKATVTNESSF